MSQWKNKIVGHADVPPGLLIANDRNFRTHPQAQKDALRDSIADIGFIRSVTVNKRTDRIVDGHERVSQALETKQPTIPVEYVELTDAEEAEALLLIDPIAAMAEADAGKLDALLREIDTGSEALQALMADLAKESGLYLTGDQEPLVTEEEAGAEDEDALDILFKAPFQYFGGKSRVARKVWQRFGSVKSYIEPFFGSGAVLLNRPLPFEGVETVNDADGLICNAWRAIQAAPDDVAKWADWPVNENDANARHAWLVARKDALQAKLEGDPDYFDAKIAGWWLWGMACWIGSGFCSGNGPWQVVKAEDGSRKLVLTEKGDAGRGVNRKLVHLSGAGRGVNRQLVHLGDAGRGVNRQLVNLGGGYSDGTKGVLRHKTKEDGNPGLGELGLLEWMRALSERLRRVRVCCGDWTRICGGKDGDALAHFFSAGEPCGVFLDPPYSAEADRDNTLYRKEDADIAHAVCDWAFAHGNDQRLRICVCGYADEGHEKLTSAGWECVKWKAAGGMSGQSKTADPSQAQLNAFRERLWFSPHCLKPPFVDRIESP